MVCSKDLSNNILEKYIHQNILFHKSNASSKIIRNIITEISSFNGIILSISILLSEVILLLAICLFLIFNEPLGTFIILLTFLFGGYLYQKITKKRIKHYGIVRQHNEQKRIKIIQEILKGIIEIKILKIEDFFKSRFKNFNSKLYNSGKWQSTFQALPRVWIELIAILSICLLFVFFKLNQYSEGKILSNLAIYLMAASRLLPSISRILVSFQKIKFNSKTIDIIYNENNLKFETNLYKDKKLNNKFNEKITLKDIHFKYPKTEEFVLENLNLDINKNSIIGIYGKSGVGKTTLINILSGLLKIDKGEIKIDHNDSELRYTDLVDYIYYIPQATHIYDTSIKDNIALGLKNEEIDNKKLELSIKVTNLEELVKRMNTGNIGESGAKISIGQAQRIGIARAFYFDREILIFDEPTSSLDAENEKDFIKSIDLIRGQKTIIIISHKKETLKVCDIVFELKNKNLKESSI